MFKILNMFTDRIYCELQAHQNYKLDSILFLDPD